MEQHAVKAKAEKAAGTDGDAGPTLLRHIAQSDMPVSELHEKRLAKEAFAVISAGTHTTSRTLEYITYHILKNEQLKSNLSKELEPVMTDFPRAVPSVFQLEELPYLTGLVKEGHR